MSDHQIDIETQLRREMEDQLALGRAAIVQQFVLRNGKAWQGAPKPPDIPKGMRRRCYRNAALLALDDADFYDLTYVEGYAASRGSPLILIEHAWCVDEDGNVVDPTWKEPEKCLYFGVQFKMWQVHEEIQKNGVYGLLNLGTGINTDLIFRLDPSLKEELTAKGIRIPPTRRSATPSL